MINDPVFQPITINKLEIKNRICLPAMHLNMAEDYLVTDQLVDFYAERARGGAGLGGMSDAVAGEVALAGRLTGAVGLDRWVELWEKIGGLAMRAERVNLDRKQVILSAFMDLQSTARQ